MSFEMICPGCGAPSNPSTGICPYCKAILSTKGAEVNPTLDLISKTFKNGNLPEALGLISTLEKDKPESMADLAAVLLYLKILFESEGPLSKINSLISSGLIRFPTDPSLHEFLDLSKAKSQLNTRAVDAGIQALQGVTQRSPTNYLAFFILGSALHWEKKDELNAIKYLEKCITLRPEFLRAWACLGVAYKGIGNPSLAARAFQKCIVLETNPQMKSFFQSQIQS
jgi:tetratricopeptide (TPR) repeat protein